MARTSDGRIGVSVNVETVAILDKVRELMLKELGVHATYTQAVQYLAHQFLTKQDNVTE
jgi:hypothetical protein